MAHRDRGTFHVTAIVALLIYAAVGSAAIAKEAVTNREVAKYLTEAKKLAGSKRWDAALSSLQKAQQVPDRSSYADYKIDQFKGYVLSQQRKYGDAAAVFEQLGKSDQASAAQRAAHLKTASQLYMQAKQYPESARAAEAALQRRPGDAALLELAGQAKYLAGDFSGAAETMQQLVAATERRSRKPQEEWLQILLNSYYKLNDSKQIEQTWEQLLRYHAKPAYWENLLALKSAEPHPREVELYFRALKFDLGILRDPADYEALALGVLDRGLPAQAVRVLEGGFKSGALGGADEERFQRMLTYARGEEAKSAAVVKDLAAQAQRTSTGQTDVDVGRAYLSQGNYDKAIAALRRGITKGQLQRPDEARIDLGIAYFKKIQPARARETFAAVSEDSPWRDLAELWSLRAEESAH